MISCATALVVLCINNSGVIGFHCEWAFGKTSVAWQHFFVRWRCLFQQKQWHQVEMKNIFSCSHQDRNIMIKTKRCQTCGHFTICCRYVSKAPTKWMAKHTLAHAKIKRPCHQETAPVLSQLLCLPPLPDHQIHFFWQQATSAVERMMTSPHIWTTGLEQSEPVVKGLDPAVGLAAHDISRALTAFQLLTLYLGHVKPVRRIRGIRILAAAQLNNHAQIKSPQSWSFSKLSNWFKCAG